MRLMTGDRVVVDFSIRKWCSFQFEYIYKQEIAENPPKSRQII